MHRLERERQSIAARVAKAADAQLPRGVDHIGYGHEVQRFHGRNVERVAECCADRDLTVKLAIIVLRDVRWVAAKVCLQVVNSGGRRPAFLESGHVVNGLD